MTIDNYLKAFNKNPALLSQVSATTHIWSDDACAGYCLTAMQETGGISPDVMRDVLETLREDLAIISPDDAAETELAYF